MSGKGDGQEKDLALEGRHELEVPRYTDERGDHGMMVHSNSRGSAVGEEEPTEEEARTLVRVPDRLPWATWLVAVIELCERFAYYGLSPPFQNYMQNSYRDSKVPGAIGGASCVPADHHPSSGPY